MGEENAGWTIAKYLLQHERDMIGASYDNQANKSLSHIAKESLPMAQGQILDPALRLAVARWEMDMMAHDLNFARAMDEAKVGEGMGAKSSMFKYIGTELNKQKHELIISIKGFDGLAWEGEEFEEGKTVRAWLRTKANSIEGGTSEIQLNIISKHILGLPGK
ncbi:MAG: acyl-CoA dehydrogenase family protein [Bacteroidota bacterium]